MASACTGLEQGLGSQPEIEAGSRWRKHQTLASRPMISDKGPGSSALQKRIPIKIESSEASEVFIKRKRAQNVWIDMHMGRLRGRVLELHSHGS